MNIHLRQYLLITAICPLLLLTACSEPAETPVTASGQSITEVADAVDVPRYDIADFMGNTNYGGASFSPDNSKILVSHDRTGIINVYALPVDGGEEMPLTASTTDAYFAISYFNADERFIYRADQGGNELAHLYVKELDGTVTDLTPGENLLASFNGWADDYQSFYVQTNERDPRYFDVYEYQVSTGYPREMIFENNENLFPGGLSHDGNTLTLIETITTSNTNIYLQNLATNRAHTRHPARRQCVLFPQCVFAG
jgi:Tol biopolymer transport system component